MLSLHAALWPLTMLLAAPGSLAWAAPDAPHPVPPAEHKSLQEFADANKDCGEWSDGCAVCLRHGDGSFACSLPGIACQPGALGCRAPQKGAIKDKGAH